MLWTMVFLHNETVTESINTRSDNSDSKGTRDDMF